MPVSLWRAQPTCSGHTHQRERIRFISRLMCHIKPLCLVNCLHGSLRVTCLLGDGAACSCGLLRCSLFLGLALLQPVYVIIFQLQPLPIDYKLNLVSTIIFSFSLHKTKSKYIQLPTSQFLQRKHLEVPQKPCQGFLLLLFKNLFIFVFLNTTAEWIHGKELEEASGLPRVNHCDEKCVVSARIDESVIHTSTIQKLEQIAATLYMSSDIFIA
nr:uncharacterized protein LOC106028717 [Cavia porcellus]